MKIFQQNTEFDYSWEEVSTSNWQKYGPWNESCKHVIAVDTLSRTVDPSTGIVSAPPLIISSTIADRFLAANRTPDHLPPVRAQMGTLSPRRPRHIPRLRNFLCRPVPTFVRHACTPHQVRTPRARRSSSNEQRSQRYAVDGPRSGTSSRRSPWRGSSRTLPREGKVSRLCSR